MYKIKVRPRNFMILFLVVFSIWSYRIMDYIEVYKIFFPIMIICLIIKGEIICKKFQSILKTNIICFTIIIIWGLLSCLWIRIEGTEYDSLSFFYNWLIISICFSILYLNEKSREKILFYFCAFSGFLAICGWITAITGFYFNDTHESYHYYLNFMGLHRPNTIFYNINDNAVFMFFALVICFIYAEKKKNRLILQGIGIALFGGNIVLVDSRGADIALLLFLLLYFIKTKEIKIAYKFLLILVGILVIIFMFGELSETSLLSEGIGDNSRMRIYEISFNNLVESHFLGVGPGHIVKANLVTGKYFIAAVHNFFLEVACDYGMVGGTAIAIWYLSLLFESYTKSKKNTIAYIIFVSLVAFIVLSIVSSSLIGKIGVASFFSIIVAQLNCLEYQKQKENKNEK